MYISDSCKKSKINSCNEGHDEELLLETFCWPNSKILTETWPGKYHGMIFTEMLST